MGGEEAGRLNEAYLKHITTGLPFVFVKSAVSLDGKTATRTGDSRWISNEESRARVHEMRDGADAIMIGIGTVLADNPRLTTRLPGGGGTDPVRIVIDPLLRIPLDARVLESGEGAKTVVVTTGLGDPEKMDRLRDASVEVLVAVGKERVVDLRLLMKDLGARGITSVMIEGGAETAASAISSGIVDKIVYFIAPKIVGGRDAPSAVGGEGTELMKGAVELGNVRYTVLGDNVMVEAYLPRGGA
jgi:diaminohydroxyphosphoribosylaminopyrimidine deaminase/5-amino-6-(5-phosphoribosylamino)uracil reductase